VRVAAGRGKAESLIKDMNRCARSDQDGVLALAVSAVLYVGA
jgi:hypothetical protein